MKTLKITVIAALILSSASAFADGAVASMGQIAGPVQHVAITFHNSATGQDTLIDGTANSFSGQSGGPSFSNSGVPAPSKPAAVQSPALDTTNQVNAQNLNQQLAQQVQIYNDQKAAAAAQAAVQAPAVQAPAVQAPAVQAPAVQAPAVQAPAVQAPAVQAPAVQAPLSVMNVPQTDILAPVTAKPAQVGTGTRGHDHDHSHSTDGATHNGGMCGGSRGSSSQNAPSRL